MHSMKHTFIALLALCFYLMGCGKEDPAQPATSDSEANKPAPAKPEPTKTKVTTGTKLWEFETRGSLNSSPAIGSDVTVYFGAIGSKLYAIKTDSKGLAKSPWPMRGQNPQHTGRVPGAKAPVAMPPGKAFAWSMGVNQESLDRFYAGKSQAQVQKFFGKPDKTQGEWWGYTGMNITDAQGNKYSTAWFGFANGVVQQVRFDK
ncbi:MAG TPA: hypothetical protein DGP39_06740 [Verrucomicrobiales bacterium]|nr:hypothetical protein [Verrucomicrobiales bacterium]